MAQQQEVRLEDVASVGTRVSWGAILAGSVIAVSIHLLLSLLASALGLTLYETGAAGPRTLAWGGVVAALFSVAVALFCGGWVCSLLTVGETHRESLIHGMLMWSVASVLMIALVGLGFRTGYQALLAASEDRFNDNGPRWEVLAQAAGVPQERINEWKQKSEEARDNPEKARQIATVATWATLSGMLLSLATALVGAVTGAGPEFQLLTTRVAVHRRENMLVGTP